MTPLDLLLDRFVHWTDPKIFLKCTWDTYLILLRGYFFSSIECRNYSILKERTRNINYRSYIGSCGSGKRGSWKGVRWYRFMAPAGKRLPVHLNFHIRAKEFLALTALDGWMVITQRHQVNWLIEQFVSRVVVVTIVRALNLSKLEIVVHILCVLSSGCNWLFTKILCLINKVEILYLFQIPNVNLMFRFIVIQNWHFMSLESKRIN